MLPKEYYYTYFRKDFGAFWETLSRDGTMSRIGAQQRNEFGGMRTVPNPYYSGAPHFSVVDLIRIEGRDNLEGIPKERHADFLCGVFYTVFIDQVVYTHFTSDYPAFKKITEYPKMDFTAGLSRPLMMSNPYDIFSVVLDRDTAITSRAIDRSLFAQKFTKWCGFIVADLEEFFSEYQVGNLSWNAVRNKILLDDDCTHGNYGKIMEQAMMA